MTFNDLKSALLINTKITQLQKLLNRQKEGYF